MKQILKYIPQYLRYLLGMYFLGVLIFTIFRIFFVYSSKELLPDFADVNSYLAKAFAIGWRFDTVISCYILVFPFIVLSVLNMFNANSLITIRIIKFLTALIFIFAFMLCAVDIPYFKYNFSRLTVAVFNWVDTPDMMVKFIFSEFIYIVYLFVFIIIAIVFSLLAKYIRIKTLLKAYSEEKQSLVIKIIFFVVIGFVLFNGMRGRTSAPIKEGNACVSSNAFINQIGLNPVFTFVKSMMNKIVFMDDKLALVEVRRYLNITDFDKFDSPIARRVIPDSLLKKRNIVIVIMESMTADNLSRFGNKYNITPNIDSLANNGYSFDNIWSAGKHTSNGVYSTLYSYPGIWSLRSTTNVERTVYSGFPGVLKQLGYSTTYFTNHGTSFDNIGEFLPENHFDRIISQGDYSQDKIVGMYGVPDHVMFEKGIEVLSELSQGNRPFFATFMTTSNHGPYIIPDGISFKAKTNKIEKQIIEYADWSIGYFMQMASKQPWFDSTVFVFTGDHGAITGNNKYIIPLSFHHVPFIIYSNELITESKADPILGGQIDIFPTSMGVLNVSYVNNTFGINLFKEKRDYIYFSEDNKLVCLNSDFMYVFSKEKEESLFKLKGNDVSNCIEKNKNIADSMKKYMFVMLQSTQWMIEHKKTNVIQFSK
ncbi:MAG: sulfatase-like hydrolase/transferase [Bacteroidia bacterium]|nr:sulfatase-like hydrolase/transferase [Bacteroidia bacterium]